MNMNYCALVSMAHVAPLFSLTAATVYDFLEGKTINLELYT